MTEEKPNQKPDANPDVGIVLTEAQQRSRRSRSIAIAWALVAFAVLFFAVTLVRGPGLFVRPL